MGVWVRRWFVKLHIHNASSFTDKAILGLLWHREDSIGSFNTKKHTCQKEQNNEKYSWVITSIVASCSYRNTHTLHNCLRNMTHNSPFLSLWVLNLLKGREALKSLKKIG